MTQSCIKGCVAFANPAQALGKSLPMFPQRVLLLVGLLISAARQAISRTQSDRAQTKKSAAGLESGPAGKAWVHTHWYEEQVPNKLEEKRSQIFGQPASGFRLHLQPARSSNRSRERRGESLNVLPRVRRSARFGGRSGLGLHWARDQEKMLLERFSSFSFVILTEHTLFVSSHNMTFES